LHKLLRERKNELRVFQHSAEHTGFIDRLNTMLVELKRYRIDPARLEHELKLGDEKAWSKQLLDKLHDLSCICSAYEKEAAGLYVDAEDDLALLAERYEETSYAGEADIWIDDFNGFTPQEYEVLTSLMKHARSVTIALCLDRQVEADEQPEEMELFHPTAATLS